MRVRRARVHAQLYLYYHWQNWLPGLIREWASRRQQNQCPSPPHTPHTHRHTDTTHSQTHTPHTHRHTHTQTHTHAHTHTPHTQTHTHTPHTHRTHTHTPHTRHTHTPHNCMHSTIVIHQLWHKPDVQTLLFLGCQGNREVQCLLSLPEKAESRKSRICGQVLWHPLTPFWPKRPGVPHIDARPALGHCLQWVPL